MATDCEKSGQTSLENSRSPSPRHIEAGHNVAFQQASYDDETPIDNGKWPKSWQAYRSLVGGFFLMFNSWGLVNAQGTYQSFYAQHLLPNESLAWLNFLGATQCFIVLLLSGVVGRFLDAGHIRHLTIIGTILLTVSTLTLSAVCRTGAYGEGSYWLIWLTQGVGSGLGMSCFFVSSSWVVSTWFKQMKSFAIGVVASGAAVAGLVYPMMFKFILADERANFRIAQASVGTLTAVTCVIAIFCAVPNPATIVRKPASWLRVRTFIDTVAPRNKSFCFLVAAISVLFLGFYVIFFNLEGWAANNGFGMRDKVPGGVDIEIPNELKNDAIRTFWLLAIMNISSIVGRMSAGFSSDHFGAVRVHAFVMFVSAMFCSIMWPLANTVNDALAFVVIFGAFSGAVIGLPPASMANILGKEPEAQAKLGQWVGMMYSAAAIPAIIGPPVAGYLIEQYDNNYLTIQLFSGGCLFVSCALCVSSWLCMDSSQIAQRTRDGARAIRRRVSLALSRNGSKEDQTSAEV